VSYFWTVPSSVWARVASVLVPSLVSTSSQSAAPAATPKLSSAFFAGSLRLFR
jgi:hypothetical protein